MLIYNKIVLIIGYCLIISFLSCEKFVESEPPPDQVISETVFESDAGATSAVVGIYSFIMAANNILFNGGITLYPGLSSDEIFNTSPDSDTDPFINNSISPNNYINSTIWQRAYKHIYQANICMEGIDKSKALTPSIKRQLTGEVKFVRAFSYFYLYNLYGKIPLVTTSDQSVNASISRSDSSEILDQIIKDLKDADSLLTPDYISENRARPNKLTADALLARVYLYQGNWEAALQYASKVIDPGNYSLESNLDNVFIYNSPEIIWQLSPSSSSIYNTAEAVNFIPVIEGVKPLYAITSKLDAAFEMGDKRDTAWLKRTNINGEEFTYPYKYKVRVSSAKSEYNVVFRLAEQYLIRAEAYAMLGQFDNSLNELNIIRSRAGLPDVNISTTDQLLEAILHERQVELFAEWGHRWFDLKRTGLAARELQEKQGWKESSMLYPVPFGEILRNPSLYQNPGY